MTKYTVTVRATYVREMLRQFWDNGAYSEDDEAVLLNAEKVLKGETK